MTRKSITAMLLIGGVVLCIPGAIVAALYNSALTDADAFWAAPACDSPTPDQSSACISYINGTATGWIYRSKALDRVTIALADRTYDVGYSCGLSPAGACDGITFQTGTPLATAWWNGQLVAIGPAESRPAVITDNSPEYRLHQTAFFLIFAIPGVALVIAGVLYWQAPMSLADLITSSLRQWPDPPRPVQRSVAWRVALGYWTGGAYVAWFASYFFLDVLLASGLQERLAPWFLVTTLVICLAVTALIAMPRLSWLVRTSARRTVIVRHTKEVRVKGGVKTKVMYELLDGSPATTTLNTDWHGHVQPGDGLDVLSDPATGRVRRVLSDPLGVRREAPAGAGFDEAAVTQS